MMLALGILYALGSFLCFALLWRAINRQAERWERERSVHVHNITVQNPRPESAASSVRRRAQRRDGDDGLTPWA